MFMAIANIVSDIDSCGGAGGIDCAQDIKSCTAITGFAELRAIKHTFFNPMGALRAVIGGSELGSTQIKSQFGKMVDHIHASFVEIGARWPYVGRYALGISGKTRHMAGYGGFTAVFHRLPKHSAITTAIFQYVRASAAFWHARHNRQSRFGHAS